MNWVVVAKGHSFVMHATGCRTAEAYVPSLELYGVSKVRAKKDGKLAQAIFPLAEVFATPRRKAKKAPEK